MLKIFIFICLLLLPIFHSFGQITSGTLQGRLVISEGSAVEGAHLVLSGSALVRAVSTSSAEDGTFLFKNLPVGRFKLTITHVAFKRHELNDIRVSLGIITNLGSISLAPGETQLDEVVLLAPLTVVSPDAQASQLVGKTTLDKIPVGRDYKEVVTILPQVNTSYYGDGLNIAGGTGAENFYYLDGINVTALYTPPGAPETFTPSGFLPYNFIKEIKVSTGGFEAQYGKALGGNVDVMTQSGSNEFKGQVFGFLSASFLNSKPNGGTTGSTVDKTSNYDGGFSFGGPILKDKLWYYAAYSYYQNEQGVDVKGHGFYPDKTTSHVMAGKIDWAVTDRTKLNLTLIGNPSVSTPVLGYSWWYIYPDSIRDPESLLQRYESGGFNAIIMGNTEITKKTQLSYAASYYKYRSNLEATTDFGNNEQQFLDLTTNILSGGLGWNEKNTLQKLNGKISISQIAGKHDLKFGVEAEYNFLEGNNFTPGSGEVLYDGTDYYMSYIHTDNTLNSSSYTAYIQDNWSISKRLYLQLGFRFDGLLLKNDEVTLQKFNNQYQPRIGVSWYLNEIETSKISFHYGRVYQWVSPIYGRLYSGGVLSYDSIYSVDPRGPGSVPEDVEVFSEPSETPRFQNGNYDLDNMDQFYLAYQQQLKNSLSFSVAASYKILRDAFFLAIDTENGNERMVGNPGQDNLSFLPKATREYWALEVGVRGDNLKNFVYSFYYVASRNYGNYPGSYLAEEHVPTFAGFGSVNTQPAIPNSTGLLPSDRTHVFKLNASYSFKFGLAIGTNCTIQSGTPLSVYAPGIFNTRVYLEGRGSAGRTPTLVDLNFRFSYKHEKFPAKLFLDVFRVGDFQTVVDQDQLKYTNRLQTIENTNFGKPVSYQPPMALRIGAEFNF